MLALKSSYNSHRQMDRVGLDRQCEEEKPSACPPCPTRVPARARGVWGMPIAWRSAKSLIAQRLDDDGSVVTAAL